MNKQNKNICIHVCDDNPVVIEKAIKITKDLLNDERLAAEIVAYEDGNQFTERYKERKDELLILDIDMPGKSGLDILKYIVKIIVLFYLLHMIIWHYSL